jgi:beta-lactamase superfamily II metal-dependent hydrolase
MLLIVGQFAFGGFARADLIIVHFNVNNGDSTLIRDTESQKSLLIDAGKKSYGKKVIVPYLKDLDLLKIDYFLATHYDSDHIGGFFELVEAGVKFNEVLDRGYEHMTSARKKSATFKRYQEFIEKSGGKHKVIKSPACWHQNPEIDLGEKTTVEIVACAGQYLNNDCSVGQLKIAKKMENDLSIALVIRHLDFDYFIGGDLTGGGKKHADVESLIAQRVGDVDMLQVNHHGSDTSNNEVFLTMLKPEVAIISVGNGGLNNMWHLPDQVVLQRLTSSPAKAKVYLTNRGEGGKIDDAVVVNGNISVYSNGKGYTVNNAAWQVDEK